MVWSLRLRSVTNAFSRSLSVAEARGRRQLLRLLLLLPILTACLGRATPPEQVKLTQQQNEVLGKFARQVGEQEINILLKDPNDPTLPGLPVGDLLYILSKVNEDKLIRLVKGISATTTLELILAIKRVGCTRVNNNPTVGANSFDATVALNATNGLNSCKWNHFHLPNIMVQLLNGVNDQGLTTLIDTVKHTYTLPCASNPAVVVGPPVSVPVAGNLATNQALCPATTMITTQPATNASADVFNTNAYKSAVDHYSFLMKIAYIAAGFDYPSHASDPNFASETLPGPAKLYNLMNLTNDGRDMVFLLDSFDKGACPGRCVNVSTTNVLTTTDLTGNLWTDIQNNDQFLSLKNLLSIIDQVQDTSKMGIIVNGYRPLAGRYDTSYDSAQIRYYIDRLRVVLERTTTCNAASYPGTAAEQALQDFSVPNGGVAAWNSKLAKLINLISLANTGRMMDLIYYIDDGFDINHVSVTNCPGRGIDNLMVMLNNLNDTAAHINNMAGYNPPYTNLTSCSTLLFPAYANDCNNELITAAYLIDYIALDTANNNPAKRNKVKYLVENIGNTLSVLQLSCHTAVADNNPVGAAPCANRGLINLVADGSKLSDTSTVDLTAAGQKLASLMDPTNGVQDIEDMRFVIRNVTMANLSAMIKGLLISGTAKTAGLINQVSGNDCWNLTTGIMKVLDGGTGLAINPATGVGSGYVSPPAVTFGGGGAGATARAVIETDSTRTGYQTIKDVIILTHGTGYAGGTVTFTGGGGAPPGSAPTNVVGNCNYNPPTAYRGFPSATATGATGLGKMVNVINYITGSPKTVVDLINGVNDGQQLGIMINGVSRSSNLVGVLNATLDAARTNNAVLGDMVNLLNTITRADTYKLVHMLDSLGDATEASTTITVPAGDHDMVAQLIAPYGRTGNLVNANSGVGYAQMANLISSLSMHGGGGYTDGSTISGPAGLNAIINVATVNSVTGTFISNAGAGCTGAPTISLSGGGGGFGAVLVPYMSGGQVSRINILNGGSNYTVAPLLTFSGGGCTTTPVAVSYINGIGTVTVTNGGGPFTDNNLNPTPGVLTISGGGAGASLALTVSGTIAAGGMGSYSGGTGYVTGEVCPISGAGGNNGTCTVTATGGVLTGCSAIAGGANYGVGRVVKIGGQAQVVANVNSVTGAVTSYTVVNSGCGYQTTPTVTLVNTGGCSIVPVPGAVTMSNTPGAGQGSVVSIALGTAGLGCTSAIKVVIGESPYAYHADGATAIVNQVTGGKVTSISVSTASVNAAQLVQLLDRDATGTGVAMNYRPDDATWTPTSACSGSGLVPSVGVPCAAGDTLRPNISTREAMIRLLHHGVTPTTTSSKSYFNGTGGIGPGILSMDWPGIGPAHIAGAILNNVTSSSTQMLITLMNSDTVSLDDTIILLGCGDRVSYTGWTANSWSQLCSASAGGLW